jgi:hypothetical protein
MRNSKVYDLNDLTIFLEKHIFRFQVAMDDPHVFQVKQDLEDLFDGSSDIVFREFLAGDDLLKELSALAEFHD